MTRKSVGLFPPRSSRSTAEKAINGILDYVSNSSELDTTVMQQFYESTLTSLAEAKNEVRAMAATLLTRQRLSLKTNLKLAKLWLDRREYGRLTKASSWVYSALIPQLIRQLHASIAPKESDTDADADNTRGTILLEIYALEIQMYSDMKDNKKLRAIYEQTLSVRSAVPHPRIMGVIRECGGKMHMFESASRWPILV